MIDLHCHSTASDGTDSPSQIIEKAHEIGLKAIALTDHDVVDGLEEFQTAAQKYPDLWAINGVELAVDGHEAPIEILALDIQNLEPFRKRQNVLLNYRNETHKERIHLLNKLGIEIELKEIYQNPDGGLRKMVGRPHIAAVLIKKGYVQSYEEAFEKYLGKGAPAYVRKKNPPLRETIEFICENNAVASLAHPIRTKLEDSELFALLKQMKDFGLQVMECYHSDQTEADTRKFLAMSDKLGLFSTGGSDYHGFAHPGVELGIGRGGWSIPDTLLKPFYARHQNCVGKP